jgi:hypothetical protein
MSEKHPVVGHFGRGVNSTAMIIRIVQEGIDDLVPDLILSADPGAEWPESYAHEQEFSAWLVDHGMPPIIRVSDGRKTLEQECLDANTLPSIVMGMRSCSDKYKIRPQNRYVSAWKPAIDAWASGEKVTKLVGYDAGEPWRAKDYDSRRYTVRYPLIEWGWDRDDCVSAIQEAGLEVPRKSACWFCPEMEEWEILDLQSEHPELLDRALAMERNATKLVQIKGLGRTVSWQQVVDYHRDQMTLGNIMPPRASRIPCTCFDGEAA